jgi:hypothetical protein
MISASSCIVENTHDGQTLITYTIAIPSREELGSALEAEQGIQRALNQLGQRCMKEALARFDTQGEPIMVGTQQFTSKGQTPETYQSLYGPLELQRHTYQSSCGGRTYCPLEQDARILENTTVGLCQVLGSKHANHSTRSLQRDLRLSHQLELHVSRLQDICSALGQQALRKEEHWRYQPTAPTQEVSAIVVYVDGTCVPIVDEKFKQAMVGVIDLLDVQGERLDTLYIAQAPQDGKKTFFERMERELSAIKKRYADVTCVGLCDGAADLQEWLEAHCDWVTLDFYHLSEYVSAAAEGLYAEESKCEYWVADMLHKLKHWGDGKQCLRAQLREALKGKDLDVSQRQALSSALGYVERNMERLDYKAQRVLDLPIGSGVVEAACKHVIKARLCGSGMRWKRKGLQAVLTLRSLQESTGRWEQFWRKVSVMGW